MRHLLIVSALLCASPCWADGWETDGSINLGLTAGTSDKTLVDGRYTTGDQAKIRAGGLYYAGLGVDSGNDDFGVLMNLAYHFDGTSGHTIDDERFVFRRWAFDLLPYLTVGKSFRIGAGATYHFNTEAFVQLTEGKSYADFDNSLGATLFGGYNFPESKSWIELRYTYMHYDYSDFDEEEINGSHFGLILHWVPSI
ncbi:MAG: outer membrane beta-barrel protein [Gammaproteobacteria bacterium]|nr:outer membrane beta-barrel protein [Gammaproteobacteria bacterium]